MAKDHFVPRHYLRHFAIDGSELIAAANVSPYKYRGVKGIGGECQQADFEEGDKALGDVLKMLENDVAPALAEVVRREDYTQPQVDALRWLAASLHMRTRKAAEAYKVFPTHICFEEMKEAIVRGELPPPPEGEFTKEMIDWGGVPAFLVKEVLPCALHMQTLACKLLKAPSTTFFITSDNPVVVLNQLCEKKEPHRSFVGFGRAGFQLLLPISPRLCLIFYDAKIYKVVPRRYRLIQIDGMDTEIVNSLQVQSADRSVYFHDPTLESQVRSLASQYAALRVPLEDWLRTIPGKGQDEELVYFGAASCKLPKLWGFCRLRRRPTLKMGDLRDPLGSALIDALMADFDNNPKGGDLHTRLQRILADPTKLKNVHIV